MNQTSATSFFNNLLKQEPSEVQAWLEKVWLGNNSVPENFNWHGFAEVAAQNARGNADLEKSTPSNLEWAKIAILLYEYLSKHESDNSKIDSYILSAMSLRAYMISLLGNVSNSPVLDSNCIYKWFFNSLLFSPTEALDIASTWQNIIKNKQVNTFQKKPESSIFLDKVRELRRIKNRLNVLKLIHRRHQHQDEYQEINSWLSIQNQLP